MADRSAKKAEKLFGTFDEADGIDIKCPIFYTIHKPQNIASACRLLPDLV